MQIQMKPTSYYDKTGYFFSSSQSDQFDGCKRQWEYSKFTNLEPHDLEFFPFQYGTFVHNLLEYCMEPSREDWRKNRIYEYLAKNPKSDKINQQLSKYSIMNFVEKGLIPRFVNLENAKQSCEIELGVKAPDDWFDEGYLDPFLKHYPNVNFIGFRGKIDYYGRDLKDNKIKVIDWKTGKPRSYKMKSYEEQVSQYAYLFYAHGYEFDGVSLYFVDAKEEVVINPDAEKGEMLIKDKLTRHIKWIQNNKYFPKNRSSNCDICQYNLKCHKEDNLVLQMW